MTDIKFLYLAFLFGQLVTTLPSHAQPAASRWSKAVMTSTIDSVSVVLQKNYVFPDTAARMVQYLKDNLADGRYNSINSPAEFAGRLTQDLQSVSKDKHLRVSYGPGLIAAERKAVTRAQKERREDERGQEMRLENYGFQEVKMLDANIGYLDLRTFADPKYGGRTAVAAMNMLMNADAVIVDLRQNGGGSPKMIQLISSYFFGSEPVHLNSFFDRPTNKITQTWTLPYIDGLRRPEIELFVLTSKYTFSAAEEFSYNLKNLKRATIIGEVTGGGAHPTQAVIANDDFFVRVPSGRAINPITHTNWEGTGVTPDHEVDASQALMIAQIKALEKLHATTTDSLRKRLYKWTLDGVKAKSRPASVHPDILKSYAGTYGPGSVVYENGGIYYLRDGGRFPLIATDQNKFVPDGMNYYRIEFVKEGSNEMIMMGHYQGGGKEKHFRK